MTSRIDPPHEPTGAMTRVVEALERDLAKIRVGAASASLLDGIMVDHLGRRARLTDLATVSIPDPRQIVVRPWDPTSLRAIGTAISHSGIGLAPTIDGGVIRLYVPGITAERREELVQLVRRRVERAHVAIRGVRHETLAAVRARERAHAGAADQVRRELDRLQRATDRASAAIDRIGAIKQADLRRV